MNKKTQWIFVKDFNKEIAFFHINTRINSIIGTENKKYYYHVTYKTMHLIPHLLSFG